MDVENVQWNLICPMDPMDMKNIQWRFVYPVDICRGIGDIWEFEHEMSRFFFHVTGTNINH